MYPSSAKQQNLSMDMDVFPNVTKAMQVMNLRYARKFRASVIPPVRWHAPHSKFSKHLVPKLGAGSVYIFLQCSTSTLYTLRILKKTCQVTQHQDDTIAATCRTGSSLLFETHCAVCCLLSFQGQFLLLRLHQHPRQT